MVNSPMTADPATMGAGPKLLKFDTYYSTFINVIRGIRDKKTYTDVTVVCNGKFYALHKLVLAICSEYFNEILEKAEGTNPMVILTGIECSDLELLLDYMYTGEVNVRYDKIPSLMKAAQILKVKDLVIQNEEANTFSHSHVSEEMSPLVPGENTSTSPCLMDGNNISTSLSHLACESISSNISHLEDESTSPSPCQLADDNTSERLTPLAGGNTFASIVGKDICGTRILIPEVFIKQEQDEETSLQQHSFESTEESKRISETNEAGHIINSPLQKRRKTMRNTSTCDNPNIAIKGKIVSKDQNLTTEINGFMAAIYLDDELNLKIFDGKIKNSIIATYGGYRYNKDGKILASGYQSWRCTRRGCLGRIYTLDDKHVTVKQVHDHKPYLQEF